MSEIKNDKAEQFIERLMANPGLSELPPLKKETQIISFLKINGNQLFPTLSSPAFFPGKERSEIDEILISTLRNMTNRSVIPPLKAFLGDSIRSSALTNAVDEEGYDGPKIKTSLLEMLSSILASPQGREALGTAMVAYESSLFDRYIPKAVERKRYISFEIRMVQRYKEIQENIIDYVKMTILLRPIVATYLENRAYTENGCISPAYAKQIFFLIKKKHPNVPDAILKGIIDSSVSFELDSEISATSRLANLFTQRVLNWNPHIKVDRGAESSDKSWFSIARKNHQFYGYDKNMLMELYNIAAELGW